MPENDRTKIDEYLYIAPHDEGCPIGTDQSDEYNKANPPTLGLVLESCTCWTSAKRLRRLMQEDETVSNYIRDLFIMIDTMPTEELAMSHYIGFITPLKEDHYISMDFYLTIWQDVNDLYVNKWAKEEFTTLALSLSLCPMHLLDYAICFDDDTPECAAIRIIHPSHDT